MMIFSLILALTTPAVAAEKDTRGLMPDLRTDAKSEDENDKRALQTELLITKAETKAIESLQKILARKKGSEEEPDLLHRLAEMYMRRARTGRFMDLNKDSKTLRLSTFPLPPEKGSDWIRKASAVYTDIEKRFPKYRENDSVVFNNAFANQQLGRIRDSEQLYQRLIDKYSKSRLVPDAAVALAELAYDQRRFGLALGHLEVAEKYPESRVYTYALYKAAWAHYNLKQSDPGVDKLLAVVKACPAEDEGEGAKNRQNLRREAMRDLALFVGETRPGSELYGFFRKIATPDELGQAMMDLSKLYLSHSRFKELDSFLSDFRRDQPKNIHFVKANLMLVDANEALKDRAKVLDVLRVAAEQCRPGSSWRAAQSEETVKESCVQSFRVKSNEIAAKWWDVWQKNKAHKEFSGLTEQALRIVLDNEDVEHPDLNSRFSYAELLFQLGRFEEAADNYAQTATKIVARVEAEKKDPKKAAKKEQAGTLSAEEVKRLHDADYGALFATEKAIEKKKTPLLEARRKEYAQTYLTRHPKAEHAGEVTLKMAVILYEEQDLDGSRKWLTGLLDNAFGRDLQKKAEDLELDILNLRKDYKGLIARSQIFLKRELDAGRKQNLQKIEIEASYAQMQDELKTLPKPEAAARLKAFAKSHAKTKLASDALYQAAAMDFTEGRGLAATEAVEEMAAQDPDHQKLTDMMKESARVSAESGEMEKAARLLLKLADRDAKNKFAHQEAAADFLLMEGKTREARGLYNLLLPSAGVESRTRLYTKLLETFRDEPESAETKKLENLMLSQNLEPFATRILTKRANAMLDAGKATEAFEAAKKIINRDAPSELRAGARLIQARILENEFTRQSVKTSKEDRLAMVLGLKTEKLEKAQTAYLSASKMTTDGALLTEAFSGIDRCYGNFIDSLESLQPPASLSAADQKALKDEIAKIIVPFREKREDNRKEIRKLASAASGAKDMNWADLGGEASPSPRVAAKWTFLKPYLAETWSDDAKKLSRYETSRKPACETKQPEFNRCYAAGNWDVAEKAARELTQAKETRVRGLHDLALVAEARGLTTKALWLLRLAEKDAPKNAAINYEKGRLLAKLEGNASASADFAEVLDASMSSTETAILKGFKAFSEGDFTTVKNVFAGFSTRELYDLNLGLLLSESYAQLGDSDKALKVVNELSNLGRNAELLIQKGRLEEVYKFAPVQALEAYTEAAKLAKDSAQKDWLVRKTEYLKVNFKVGLNVTSRG